MNQTIYLNGIIEFTAGVFIPEGTILFQLDITDNENVRQQMILLMDTYKIELQERQLAAKRKEIADGDNNGLDNLIRVS